MTNKKAGEIRDLSKLEQEAMLRDQREALYTCVNEVKSADKGGAKHKIRQTRRSIARILTVMGEGAKA
jgi:ribosomal protein L29